MNGAMHRIVNSAVHHVVGRAGSATAEYPSATRHRRGFSLLESILALAILGVSLAVLSQIVATGVDAGLEADDLLRCRLAADAKMSQTLINLDQGITPVTTLGEPAESFVQDDARQLTTDIEVLPATMTGLLTIRVTARAARSNYALTRQVVDPAFIDRLTTQ